MRLGGCSPEPSILSSAPQERVSLGCFRRLLNHLEHPSETPLRRSSGRHLRAACRTGPAGAYAVLHLAKPLAIAGAVGADLGAFGTKMPVMARAGDHDMRSRPADLGAGEHQLNMVGFRMLASELKAMVRRHAEAGPVTAQAVIDTALHGGIRVAHLMSPLAGRRVFCRPGRSSRKSRLGSRLAEPPTIAKPSPAMGAFDRGRLIGMRPIEPSPPRPAGRAPARCANSGSDRARYHSRP
jgi:hypothetical protein